MVALTDARFATTDLPVPEFVRTGRARLLRFTVDEYVEMIRAGIVPEDLSYELIDGFIVRKNRAAAGDDVMSIGLRHRTTVMLFGDLNQSINSADRHVASQQPMRCSNFHLPEPDFAIIRGVVLDYRGRYPTGRDATCVVEVSDSSYEDDSTQKLEAYARAGVEQYVIVNLRNDTAEVYERPDVAAGTYPPPAIVAASQALRLNLGEGASFDVILSSLLG